MNASDYWNLFMETGAPECYLLFQAARRRAEQDVYEDPGTCAPSNGVQ